MKLKTISSFLLLLVLLSPLRLKAFSFEAGEISYQHLSGSPNSYRLNLALYTIDNGGPVDSSQIIYFQSSCQSLDSSTAHLKMTKSISPFHLNPCIDSSISLSNSYLKLEYEVDINLAMNCSDWNFYWQECCRNPNINNIQNPSSSGIYLLARLNNNFGPNSSPQFSGEAIRQYCLYANEAALFKESFLEADGDSIVYRYTNPKEGPFPGSAITWANGYSLSNPLGLALDSSKAYLEYVLLNKENDAIRFEIDEYRFDPLSGQWISISTVSREMHIQIVDNCLASSVNWGLFGDDLHTSKKIIGNCGMDEILIYCSNAIDISSLNFDASEFEVFNSNGNLLALVSAIPVAQNGLVNAIKIKLHQPLMQNDSLSIVTRIGPDSNTILSRCGFSLPLGERINLIVRDCNDVGLNENKIRGDLFPNPFNDELQLHFKSQGIKNISIYNSNAQLIFKTEFKGEILKLDTKEFPPGIYFLRLEELGITSSYQIQKL